MLVFLNFLLTLYGYKMKNIYQNNGYKNRADYLENLSFNYCISIEQVQLAADMLGPNEDFDGLINTLEDIEQGFI